MAKRSGKFYINNEKEVMKSLGFKPVPGSGSGWIDKEDGESEYALCQLKSTDADSIKINKKDLDALEYHSLVSHKLPVFAIQFLKSNEVFLVIRPDVLPEAHKLILGEKPNISRGDFLGLNLGATGETRGVDQKDNRKHIIKSGSRGQKDFRKSEELKYKKERKSAL